MKYTTMNENEFHNKVTVISFIMAVLVISWHTDVTELYILGNTYFDSFVKNFVTIVHNIEKIAAVPFFFIISGYLFFRNYTLRDTGRKWKSRFFSIVLPWFIWGNLYWIYYLILSMASGGRFMGKVKFTFSSWGSVVLAHENTIFWYLQTSIFFILLTPILYIILKNNNKLKNGFGVLCIVLCLCTSNIIPDNIFTGIPGGVFSVKNLEYWILYARSIHCYQSSQYSFQT